MFLVFDPEQGAPEDFSDGVFPVDLGEMRPGAHPADKDARPFGPGGK